MKGPIMCFFSHTSMLLLMSVGFSFAVNAASRRLLHQPFFPLESSPPAPSPSPPPDKIPFTGSENGSTFFPGNPPPPPPPSPSAFATVPANISSVIVPNSQKSNHISQKLVAVSLAACLSAVVVTVFVILYHRSYGCPLLKPGDRKIHGRKGDGSSVGSSNAGAGDIVYSSILGTAGTDPDRKSITRAANSEFFYLGTVADSHPVDADELQKFSSCSSSKSVSPRIFGSPELQPLPPLKRSRSFQDVEPVFIPDEDNDEFYSPRGSIGPATLSTPLFPAVGSRMDSETSSETSAPGSPVISDSHSLTPSLRRSSSGPGSPSSLRRNSTLQPSRADSLSPESRSLASPRLDHESNDIDLGRRSVSSATVSSPEMESQRLRSPVTSSPSPKLSSTPDTVQPPRKMEEVFQTSTPPDGNYCMNKSVSPSLSSSPERGSNASTNNSSEDPKIVTISAAPTPPPPPPPPPPLTQVKSVADSPTFTTPKDKPILSRPPPLVPPSRPFVISNTGSHVSPMELPPADPPADADGGDCSEEGLKPKLKPLHWDKVRASSDREMVWDHLRSSSFKLNEEMFESLFLVNTPPPPKAVGQTPPRLLIPKSNQEDRVLDPKRAQNIAILLRALNVTNEEVCEALLEGNTDTLGAELLESLLKMAPTKEEEKKLRDFKDDPSSKLGQAEKFLKAVLDIPLAFKRAEALLYVSNFDSEINYLKKSFETLEKACEELRNCRLFLKLLETVLKTGNRMNVGTNRGDALAFKLDTLLMLVDVKGADGKTTLLHFVVQEIIRTEGARISDTDQTSTTASEDAKCRKLGLQVVSGLSSELAHVKKSATMDFDLLSNDVEKLSKGIQQVGDVVKLCESQSDGTKFSESMNKFLKFAEEEMIKLQAQERGALSLVKEITEYFHGNSAKEEAHPFRIFMVVRDFLGVLDRVCKEVGLINDRTTVSSAHKFPVPVNPTLSNVNPTNSDEETSSS